MVLQNCFILLKKPILRLCNIFSRWKSLLRSYQILQWKTVHVNTSQIGFNYFDARKKWFFKRIHIEVYYNVIMETLFCICMTSWLTRKNGPWPEEAAKYYQREKYNYRSCKFLWREMMWELQLTCITPFNHNCILAFCWNINHKTVSEAQPLELLKGYLEDKMPLES